MSSLIDELNFIIAESESKRGMKYPRIGKGHAGHQGGIFSLLCDPGGEYTTGTGAIHSEAVDLDNEDDTAAWGINALNGWAYLNL